MTRSRRRLAIVDRPQTTVRGRRIETPKDKPGLRANACLGSLAVKRVLGKDETPDSYSGIGFLSLVLLVVIGFFIGERMYTTQERVPGVVSDTSTLYSDSSEKTGILHYVFKSCWSLALVSRQRCRQ